MLRMTMLATLHARPGDRQQLPGIVRVMENGQTKFQIGSNDNLFDWTYVENVAHAHLLAADRLETTIHAYDFAFPVPDVTLSTGTHKVPTSAARPLGPTIDPTEDELRAAKAFASTEPQSEDDPDMKPVLRTRMDQFTSVAAAAEKTAEGTASEDDKANVTLAVAGQAFFITNCEPMYFWDYMRAVWKGLGHVAPYTIKLPSDLGIIVATAAELWSKLTGREAGFTRFRVKFATQKRYYNVERARRLLGYEPIVGVEEGIKRTLEVGIQSVGRPAAPADLSTLSLAVV
jgi:sterol-4alpha-carboxylate 3-dehydrogenase (decarboxylating)